MPRKAQPRRKSVVRYVDQHGCQVPKGTPGARKVKTLTETYYWRGQSLGTTDLAVAWEKVRALLRRERDQALGIRDDYTDHAGTPIEDHVAAWAASVRDKGTSEKEVRELASHVSRLTELAGWKRLADVTARTCLSVLARLTDLRAKARPKVSAQTRNHYLRHVKQFLAWCVDDHRCRDNPLVGLKPVSVESDRRHDRRCPTEAEVALLMSYLEGPDAAVRRGMSGPRRALGYRVCMATGFRAGELRALSRPSFDLERGEATCPAAYSKRRRKDTMPLPAWLVGELRAWFAAGGECWDAFPADNPGQVLEDDLEAAGIPYSINGLDGFPLFLDFHSLRHYYVSWAANQPGISPKTLMELARHSTPTLTLKTYARARRIDLHRTVEDLPRPGGSGCSESSSRHVADTGAAGRRSLHPPETAG